MVENFSWVEDKKDNFKEYVLNLADSDVENILGNIPSGWNYPPTSHRGFVEWLINRIKPEVTVGLGVASNNAELIQEIKETFKL